MRNSKIIIAITTLLTLGALLWACAPANGPHLAPKNSGTNQNANQGTVGYDQLKPIFAVCTRCHPGIMKPDWTVYSQAKEYALNGKLQNRFVIIKDMPQLGSPEASEITDAQRQLVAAWIAAGAPETSSANSPGGTPGGTPGSNAPAAVQACISCHGADGLGTSQSGVPRLAGMPKDYLVTQLTNFKWRSRIDPSNTMNAQALHLTDDNIQFAAAYFSTLATYASANTNVPHTPDQDDLYKKGEALAVSCATCHVAPGKPPLDGIPPVPTLYGQQRDYLFGELLLLRAKIRHSDIMNGQAEFLKDDDISGLTLYFSTTKPPTP